MGFSEDNSFSHSFSFFRFGRLRGHSFSFHSQRVEHLFHIHLFCVVVFCFWANFVSFFVLCSGLSSVFASFHLWALDVDSILAESLRRHSTSSFVFHCTDCISRGLVPYPSCYSERLLALQEVPRYLDTLGLANDNAYRYAGSGAFAYSGKRRFFRTGSFGTKSQQRTNASLLFAIIVRLFFNGKFKRCL